MIKMSTVECPTCGAPSTGWCMKTDKQGQRVRAGYTHKARVKLWHAMPKAEREKARKQ